MRLTAPIVTCWIASGLAGAAPASGQTGTVRYDGTLGWCGVGWSGDDFRAREVRPQSCTVAADGADLEEALQAATSADDFSVTERLLDVLARPYDHDRDVPLFSSPGTSSSGERPYRTFCGT